MNNILEKYSYILNWIIILFPLFLISGPFLPDFFCVLIGLVYICFHFKNDKFSRIDLNIFYFFLLLYLYLILNSIFGFNYLISLQSSLTFIRIVVFIFALKFFFQFENKIIKKIYFVFFILLILLFLDSTYQFFSGTNILGYTLDSPERITSFFKEEQIMGSYVARLIPCVLGLSYLIEINKRNFLNGILLLLAGILIFLSGERLASAYYLIILILFFFINSKEKKFIFYFFLFFIISLSILNFFKANKLKYFINHTYNQLIDNKTYFTSYRHFLHYRAAYEMFKDKPFLGHGLKSFRYLCSNPKYAQTEKIIKENMVIASTDGFFYIDEYKVKGNRNTYLAGVLDKAGNLTDKKFINYNDNLYSINYKNGEKIKKGSAIYSVYEFKNGCNTHPHNIYLQFLSELGLIGFCFFLLMFFYIIMSIFILVKKKINIKLEKVDKAKFFILVGLFVSMFPLFPSGNYFNNWLLIITYYPIGVYLYLLSYNNNSDYKK